MSLERDDHGRRIPSWGGQPDLWETYKEEVRIWRLGCANTEDYSLAARLVSHLRGPARRIGQSMTDEELMPVVTEGALPPIEVAEDAGPEERRAAEAAQRAQGRGRRTVSHVQAIETLMKKLEVLAPQTQERRGLYLRDFFTDKKYVRRTGERLVEWIPRWEEGVTRLQRDGIDFFTVEDLPGFFFLEHVHLSESRLEMLRSAMDKDKLYDLRELKLAVQRLFPFIHKSERLSQPRRRYTAHVADQDDEEEEDEEEDDPQSNSSGPGRAGGGHDHDDDEGDHDLDDVQECYQAELQELAEELEELGELDADTVQQLEDAAITLSQSQQGLEVIRQHRARVKGGRGKGGRRKGGGKSGRGAGSSKKKGPPTHPPASRSSGGQRPSAKKSGKAQQSGRKPQQSIRDRKANSQCSVCFQYGHWHDDPECPGPPARGSRGTMLADHEGSEDSDDEPRDVRECSLVHALAHNVCLGDSKGHPDGRRALLDTCCAKSVCGDS